LTGSIRFPLETERLSIRPMVLADADDLHALHADPTTWDYISSRPSETLDETMARVARQVEEQDQLGFSMWAVVERASGKVVGDCGLQMLEGNPEMEIGWHVARAWRGRGIATEAARACLAAGFDQLGLDRIVAVAWPTNGASLRVMEKLGMNRVGPAFHYQHETVLYTLTRQEAAAAAAHAG
jgi:ribosomal-protein-alanine N-acetyltransferase